jgi:hypothetical protein
MLALVRHVSHPKRLPKVHPGRASLGVDAITLRRPASEKEAQGAVDFERKVAWDLGR